MTWRRKLEEEEGAGLAAGALTVVSDIAFATAGWARRRAAREENNCVFYLVGKATPASRPVTQNVIHATRRASRVI